MKLAAALILLWSSLLAPLTLAANKPELVFLNWEEYINPEVIAEFERQENCLVRFVYFDDDDERNMILANTQATGFDLVLVDHTMLDTYRDHGWLLPMTYRQVPNARHASDPWHNQHTGEPFYGVSYLWGGLGIVYHKDRMNPAPTHWLDLFQPQPYLKGRMLLLNTVQTTFGLTLMALGHPFNSTDPDHIEQATRLLTDVRPYVHEFRNIRLGEDSELIKGNIDVAVTYNGDAMKLMEHSDQLAFIYPKEGVPLWLDTISVLKSSKQPALALKLVDFLNRPDIAARNALHLKYATTNLAALEQLPDSFRQDKRIFPDHSAASGNQLYQQLPIPHLRRITARLVQIMAQ